jgi:LuxR family maltose regulon positive regulatory protein
VTGYKKSTGLLREMEADNLFLIPMDDRREWYRYHNLYRDFLKTRMDPHRSAELHIRAANWFLDTEQYPDAVKHALAADNMDYAERVISQAVVAAHKRGAFGSLDSWLNTVPAERLLNNVVLATSKGFSVYYTKSYQDALPYAEAAENCIDETTNHSVQGQYLSLKAHLAMCTEEFETCLCIATHALDLLDEDDMVFRTLTLNVIGQVHELQGEICSAVDIYRRGFESAWRAGDVIGALVVAVNLIFSLNELGLRREALRWFEYHLNAPEQRKKIPRSIQDAALLAPSLLAYEANDLVVARDYAERAVTVLKKLDFPHGTIWGLYILAKIDLAEHRFVSARQLCEEGGVLARQIGREAVHGILFSALTAQVDLESSTRHSARRWADQCGFTERDIPTHWLEQPYFTFARILLADGQIQAANQLLANIQQSATRASRKRKIITTHLLMAQSSLLEGNQVQAREYLGIALEMASAEDYRRAILDEDRILLKLLPEMLSRAPEFVQQLISAGQQQPEQNNLPGNLINPLTHRELEVLGLVASGMSNREIAEKLVVSLGTVKKHLNNIFSKLYVESRTQAVVIARKQGLLS